MTRPQRNGRRAALEQAPRRRGGGLFLGIAIGLVAGLVVAAGIAWYLLSKPSPFKPSQQTASPPPATPPGMPEAAAPADAALTPLPAMAGRPQPKPAPPPTAPKAQPPAKPVPTPAVRPSAPSARADYTFFDILPGEPNGKSPQQKLVREVWWLQVAALKQAQDADRLKARLVLLGLPVQIQQVTSGEAVLHRVRVGPFKTEDDALAALDTLSENNFEPRLLKEQSSSP